MTITVGATIELRHFNGAPIGRIALVLETPHLVRFETDPKDIQFRVELDELRVALRALEAAR